MKHKDSSKSYPDLTVVGLVGGVASGKSSVARALAEKGAHVIDSDAMAHHLLDEEKFVQKIRREFGEDVLVDGKVDHAALANVVFNDEKELEKLNSIMHPPLLDRIRAVLEEKNEKEVGSVVVIDAALLLEAGLGEICDYVVYVQCSLKTRLWRARQNRQWKNGDMKRREKFQLMLGEKRNRSDFTVNNNLSPGFMKKEVDRFWKEFIERKDKNKDK